MEGLEQTKLITELHNRKMSTIKSKGSDYANDDVLSNFKGASAVVGISAPRQILSLIATKVARLANLIDRPGTQKNESVEDSILDLSAYTDLLYCMMHELNADKATKDYVTFDAGNSHPHLYNLAPPYVTEESSGKIESDQGSHGQNNSYYDNNHYKEQTWDSYSYSPL